MTVRTTSGRTQVQSLEELKHRARFGSLEGTYFVRKFGGDVSIVNATIRQDLWNGPTNYETLLSTAQTMYASCTDNTNGVGQVLSIEGLDADWNRQFGLVTLNGNTQVAVTQEDGSAATWTRIFRAYQVSAEPDPQGDVYIAETDTLTGGAPDTDTKVHAYVQYTNGENQTKKCMYTVPAGSWGLLLGISASMESSTGQARSADVYIEVQNMASGSTVASPEWAPFRRVHELSLNNASTVTYNYEFAVPDLFSPLTNIHMRAHASTGLTLVGSFELLVFPDAFIPS